MKTFIAGSTLFWPIPARSICGIEFTFGEPYRIHHADGSLTEVTYPSTLIGTKTRQRIRLELRGRVETFSILFQPTGLQRLFCLPGREIVDQHYEADAVLGPGWARLRSQLGEAGSFAKRVQIADAFFSAAVPDVKAEPRLDGVLQDMISKQGCVRIKTLAHDAGVSLRQLERRFVTDLGIGPKHYARILRFEGAILQKAASGRDWTTVAHELGYHDQMHMIHDFQALSGERPTSLAPHLEFLSSLAAESRVSMSPGSWSCTTGVER